MNIFKVFGVVMLFLLSLVAVSNDVRAWGDGYITLVVEVDGDISDADIEALLD